MNSSLPSVLTRSRRRLVVLLIAIALTALALAFILSGTTARGASIYASIASLGVIERYDAITGADLGAFATHLSTPGGMVFDRAGNLYINETGSATIRKIAPNGSVSVFYTGGAIKGSNALAIDADGSIYVANYGTNRILRITTAGFLSTFAAGGGINISTGMAFDSGGNLFVSNSTKSGGGTIVKITPDGLPSIFYSGISLVNPGGIVVDRDDTLLVVDGFRLDKITPSGVLSVFTTYDLLNSNARLLLGAAGDVLFTGPSGSIYRRNAAGSLTTLAIRQSSVNALVLGPNPIPEPSTLSLSLIGVSGCWLNARRGRRDSEKL